MARQFDDRIYYEDQTAWDPEDWYGLWRYINRLNLYVGPTPAMVAHPEIRTARIEAKRWGVRDDELESLNLERMSAETQYLWKHMLIHQMRYDLALERFPNLCGLADVGELGHAIVLDRTPCYAHPYLTERGIIL